MSAFSFLRAVWIALTVLAFTGILPCRNELLADDAKEKPARKEAKAEAEDRPPQKEKAAGDEKAAADKGKGEFKLEAVVGPLQQLFGVRGQEAEMDDAEHPARGRGNAQQAPDEDPMVMQFLQMHQSKVKAELRFVRLMYRDLPREQRPKVRTAAEQGLKEFAIKMVKQQKQPRPGVNFNAYNQEPGPTIREAILQVLKESLSEEQLGQFKQEQDQRSEDRKRAIILGVISLLDGKLFLDQDQRKKIEETLKSRWQDEWYRWSMYSLYGGQYLPTIPEQCVAFCLNSEQKKVWNGLQKVDFGWWNNDNQMLNKEEEDWWGVDANGQKPEQAVNQEQVIIIQDRTN